MLQLAKRGRKRKAGARYPSGKLRPQPARDVMDVVLEARHRQYRRDLYEIAKRMAEKTGKPSMVEFYRDDAAKSREAGTAYGIALLKGEISQAHFDALEAYDIASRDYETAIAFRRPRSASDFSGPRGHDPDEGDNPEYVAWCERTITRYRRIRHAILTSDDPQAHMAVQCWVDENRTIWDMIGALRIAANAIGRVL